MEMSLKKTGPRGVMFSFGFVGKRLNSYAKRKEIGIVEGSDVLLIEV